MRPLPNGLAGKGANGLGVAEIIGLLGLAPHPREGGYFAEMYRSEETVAGEHLPERYGGPRCLATCIYFLLTADTRSRLHRLKSDEVWHFLLGDPVLMCQLFPDGGGRSLVLGADLAAGMQPQALIPRGVWMGARLARGWEFALFGCTVSPGFEYADYEDGDRQTLLLAYPQFAGEIKQLS